MLWPWPGPRRRRLVCGWRSWCTRGTTAGCRSRRWPCGWAKRARSADDDETWQADRPAPTLSVFDSGDTRATVAIVTPATLAVRRLTPVECERLQGFPDDWTNIPYRGKPAADGPRYKAIGNSMAVPVMRWIGERIDAVDRATKA